MARRYEITRVRLERPLGAQHDHISDVELSGRVDQRFPRSVVVLDLRSAQGDRYYTNGGGAQAEVVVRSCPSCGFRDYITTLPDSTTANNLLHLPRF